METASNQSSEEVCGVSLDVSFFVEESASELEARFFTSFPWEPEPFVISVFLSLSKDEVRD